MLFTLVPIILIAWFPLAILLFNKMPSGRALIFGVLAAVMFLPMGEIEMRLIPGRKDVLVNLGLLVAALLMDPRPLVRIRPRLVDLPVLGMCIGPFISATVNGQPPYNAFSSCVAATVTYAVPYFLGRAYLNSLAAVWHLAQGIVVAGLIYAPGCIIEMFLGPQLHERLYGFPAFPDYLQSIRGSGYRPNMFMQHGLMVSTFMCCAALMSLWLWQNRAFRRFYGIPAGVTTTFLLIVAVGCRSAGALILMLIAMGVLYFTRFTRKGILAYILVAAPPLYILARTLGGWTGENAVQFSNEYLGEDKGGSLQVRFENENVLVDRAMQKPLFGWGTDGEFLIKDYNNRITSIPDGLWVIALGSGGMVGLVLLYGTMLMPVVALIRRFPARTWQHPAMAAPGALAIFLVTYAIDCLMNAMINPIYLVALGSVAGLSMANLRVERSRTHRAKVSVTQVSRRPPSSKPLGVAALPAIPGRA